MITALYFRDGKMVYSVTEHLEEELIAALLMVEADKWIRLHSVYVVPEHRGKGLARSLMLEALRYRPDKEYYLEVDSFGDDTEPEGLTDGQLRAFYSSLGFVDVDSTPYVMKYVGQ